MLLVFPNRVVESKPASEDEARDIIQKDDYLFVCFPYWDKSSLLFQLAKPEKVRLLELGEHCQFYVHGVPTLVAYPAAYHVQNLVHDPTIYISGLDWPVGGGHRESWAMTMIPPAERRGKLAALPIARINRPRVLFYGTITDHRKRQIEFMERLGVEVIIKGVDPVKEKVLDVLAQERCSALLGLDGGSIGCHREHEAHLACAPCVRVTAKREWQPFVNPWGLGLVLAEDDPPDLLEEKTRRLREPWDPKVLEEAMELSASLNDRFLFWQCLDAVGMDRDLTREALRRSVLDEAPDSEVISLMAARAPKGWQSQEDFQVRERPGRWVVGRPSEGLHDGWLEASMEPVPAVVPVTDRPWLSLVVPCMGRLHHLKRMLPHAIRQPGCEVVLVDWSDPDGCGEWAEKRFSRPDGQPAIRIVRNPGQRLFNLSKARNLGSTAARGEWLCFIDADMILEPEFFERTKELAEAGYFLAFQIGGGGEGHPGMTIVRKEDFLEAGGFDGERFRSWSEGEEEDLAGRLAKAGLRARTMGEAHAWHVPHGWDRKFHHWWVKLDESIKGSSSWRLIVKETMMSPSVIHANGGCKQDALWLALARHSESIVLEPLPPGVEMVTWNNGKEGILETQMKCNGIPITRLSSDRKDWKNNYKVIDLVGYLKKAKSKYILALDAVDVFLLDTGFIKRAIEEMEVSGHAAIFSAEKNHWPGIPTKEFELSMAKSSLSFLNSGAFVFDVQKLKNVLQLEIRQHGGEDGFNKMIIQKTDDQHFYKELYQKTSSSIAVDSQARHFLSLYMLSIDDILFI